VVSATEDATSQPQKLSKTAQQQEKKAKAKAGIATEHIDLIKPDFWQKRAWILSGRAGRLKGRPELAYLPPPNGDEAADGVVEN